ncbi:hypothetical protein BGZ61DRAFT_450054 [Ilyonectria robusta]|uniref:uncharacterized protein n=1 Tax=Ilyonectria robusta TaxID=1079257 RepID=UPI001E8E05D2|nr:uncharacterized protein BGZ61DRAFT_450054 [Ilyonectria robusta]KAH8706529.1 hypothetical protein BGZ61DRAFT_450054 [Ilyonectria robusta]
MYLRNLLVAVGLGKRHLSCACPTYCTVRHTCCHTVYVSVNFFLPWAGLSLECTGLVRRIINFFTTYLGTRLGMYVVRTKISLYYVRYIAFEDLNGF